MDLVGHDGDIVSAGERGDALEVAFRPAAPDRVVRMAEHVGTGSSCKRVFQGTEIELPSAAIVATQRHLVDAAPGAVDGFEERWIDWRIDHDAIAGRRRHEHDLRYPGHDVGDREDGRLIGRPLPGRPGKTLECRGEALRPSIPQSS